MGNLIYGALMSAEVLGQIPKYSLALVSGILRGC
jgi:hypothetical protein